MRNIDRCFAPIAGPDTKLLILGSLPGAASLAAGRYYANPRNQFWRLLEEVIERPIAYLSYEMRIEALGAAGIGLWDTVAAATRAGSLDTNIRLQAASDVGALARTLPMLRAIAFNGGTAARIGRRQLAGRTDVSLIDLPSSSPAYTLPFADKAEAWRGLRAFLAR